MEFQAVQMDKYSGEEVEISPEEPAMLYSNQKQSILKGP